MSVRIKKVHPALKHAGYCTTALLPGEDPAAFKKLHQGLIDEFTPNGPLEEDTIGTVARLVWRKQNLETFRIAERARERWAEILSEKMPRNRWLEIPILGEEQIDPTVREAAEHQARSELGPEYAFVEMGKKATTDQLMQDLEIEEHLDAMIGRCLKQLLFLRGLKSMSTVPASAPRPGLLAPAKAT